MGRCLLVIDNSPEGHIDPNSSFFIGILQELVSDLDPPDGSVVLIDQNRAIMDPLRCAGEFNKLRRKILFMNHDFHVKKTALSLLSLKDKAFEARDDFVNRQKSGYLCMVGTPRPAKIALFHHLIFTGLIQQASYSYQGFQGAKAQDLKENLLNSLYSSDLSSVFEPCSDQLGIARAVEQLPIHELDVPLGTDLNGVALQMPYDLYINSHASLVVETDFASSNSMQRITEKTFKALAMGHPTLIFGNPFSIRLAKDLGFITFDDLLGGNYDSIENPLDRFHSVVSELRRLVDTIGRDPKGFASQVYESAAQNFDYAHGGSFLIRYEDTVESHLLEAIAKFLLR